MVVSLLPPPGIWQPSRSVLPVSRPGWHQTVGVADRRTLCTAAESLPWGGLLAREQSRPTWRGVVR